MRILHLVPFSPRVLSGHILTYSLRLGIAAFVLEMIPFASIAFSFTNTVGAALWAADLEKATK